MITHRTARFRVLRQAARRCASLSRRHVLIGIVLGCLHFALAVASIQHKSATFDELAHVTAGYCYWTRNDYRLHPENGNLPQRWMTLPLIFFAADLEFPKLETDSWRRADLWLLADEFFHRSGNDTERILMMSRSAVALVSVALCVLVFFWSRSLFGNKGGLISLALCAFSPTVLAHGRLATSDLFATFFFAAAVWSVWVLLHRVSIARLLGGAAAVSGLFLCKTSAVLVLPMAALMALVSLIPRQSLWLQIPGRGQFELTSQWSRRGCVLVVAVFIGIATYSSVWAAYGFRYAASAEGDHEFHKFQNIAAVAKHSGSVGALASWLADRRVLPEAYLYGAAFVAAHEERPAFLNGAYATKGWRHFFPYCLAVKTPLALFGLLAIGTIALPAASARCSESEGRIALRLQRTYHLLPVGIALLILWTVVVATQLNIGHRHIMPTYPFMFVLAGSAAHWCRRKTCVVAGVVVVLLSGFVLESLASFPHYLSYFNQLVPRDKAYQHLVDSSLDWGQDLPSLKNWLDRNASPEEPIYLGYFGTASPSGHGIKASSLPLLRTSDVPLELRPGTYCISATCLQAVYGVAPGRWNRQYETRYQDLHARFAHRNEPVDLQLRQQWDVLQTHRLAAYLRHRDPDDQVGYSILIYQVRAAELDAALNGPPAELDDLCWPLQRVMQMD